MIDHENKVVQLIKWFVQIQWRSKLCVKHLNDEKNRNNQKAQPPALHLATLPSNYVPRWVCRDSTVLSQ